MTHHRFRRFWRPVFSAAVVAVCAPGLLSVDASGRAVAASRRNPEDADVKESVARAIEFLKKAGSQGAAQGHQSFAAYTMLRAGVPPEDATVDAAIKQIVAKCHDQSGYRAEHANYGTAVDLMALLAARNYVEQTQGTAQPDLYREEIQTILSYLISKQNSTGDWDYFELGPGHGDTSQTQFALLALWPAAEAGFEVPLTVWEGAAIWLLETQHPDGGFSYHPRGPTNRENGIEHGMTVAGLTGVAIARRFLFRGTKPILGDNAKADGKQAANRYGLERVDTAATPEESDPKVAEPAQKTRLSAAMFDTSISRAAAWLANKYTIMRAQRFQLYYVYGLERMAALLELPDDKFAGNDWYADGVDELLNAQIRDGSWGTRFGSGQGPDACFSILFMTKATFKQLKRGPPGPSLGAGLLQSARGLNLEEGAPVEVTAEGKIAAKTFNGPLDELLNDILTNPNSKLIEDLDDAITKLPAEGKSEELISQKDPLRQMVAHPNPEVRKTALWALGRCEDLGMVPLMIKALEDENLDVIIEAQNALCMLSRRPRGFGLPLHPWDSLPENATEEAKQQAIQQWSDEQIRKWKQWYSRVRPYDQRDDLTDVGKL